MFLAALNTEVFKYVVLAGTFPLWLPFLKALYTELDDALAAEGGLLGRTPTARELQVIARDPNRSKSPLVSQDFDPEDKSGRGRRSEKAGAPAAKSAGSAPARGAPPTAGFAKPRGARGFARKDQRKP